ncbi:MAG: recombinase family protein [Thiobacillus sp.]|nr:recombinase family protein [Thiobacillus sp.]
MSLTALKRLLADIDAVKIDIVVVYKIDRLTRNLPAGEVADCPGATQGRGYRHRMASSRVVGADGGTGAEQHRRGIA